MRAICQAELGWDDARWEAEEAEYLRLWQSAYSLPANEVIPSWRILLSETRRQRSVAEPAKGRGIAGRTAVMGILVVLAAILAYLYRRSRSR